jgi:hypothetical protein
VGGPFEGFAVVLACNVPRGADGPRELTAFSVNTRVDELDWVALFVPIEGDDKP